MRISDCGMRNGDQPVNMNKQSAISDNMKNIIHQIALLRARNILYLYALVYCVKALRDEEHSAYSTQVGDNFITAWASASSGKVTLDKSFEIYGVPDVPDHFRYMSGDGNSGLVNTAAGSLAVGQSWGR
jgi:hypothetical protein